ncbi:MAG: hypothetical protein JSV96_13380 [Candidatus Aminicenantes bacterium]|nr:MAG: hypothetical protein JSV96_13380 [Candidatus Aminicenantes bacterium]
MPGIVGVAPSALFPIEEMAEALVQKQWHFSATKEGWSALGCVDQTEPLCVTDPEGARFAFLHGRPYEMGEDGHYKLIGPERCMALYSKKGIDAFYDLDGTFVFALCDNKAKESIVITDRYGHRPIYYRLRNGGLAFASEIKALVPKGELPELDKVGLAEHFLYNSAIGKRTIYKGIKVLPPAAIMKYDGQSLNISEYWSINYSQDTRTDDKELAIELIDTLKLAMQDRLKHSKRPVVTLSGGLDSRTLVAAGGEAKFGCATFGLPGCREISIAQKVARRAGKEHLIIEYIPENLIKHSQEPIIATDGQNTLLVSYLPLVFDRMRSDYEVFFNALAGDLLLGGSYLTHEVLSADSDKTLFTAVEDKTMLFDRELLTLIFEDSFLSPKDIEDARAEMKQALLDLKKEGLSYPNQADKFFLKQYVRRVTIMGSVVGRIYLEEEIPTYDLRFLEVVTRIPPNMRAKHRIYRKFLIHLSPKLASVPYQRTMLPANASPFFWEIGLIYHRRMEMAKRRLYRFTQGKLDIKSKRSYVDYERWLRKSVGWREVVYGTLLSERTAARGLLNRRGIENIIEQHERRIADHSRRLCYLASLELNLRVFEERQGLRY